MYVACEEYKRYERCKRCEVMSGMRNMRVKTFKCKLFFNLHSLRGV